MGADVQLQGCNRLLTLYIANKNYSSWSLRPWALALPSMQEWHAAALQEPWRDEAHEAETRRVGEWIADLRQPR
jgi:hypothetical protein